MANSLQEQTFIVKCPITAQDLADLIDQAVYGASTYWAKQFKLKNAWLGKKKTLGEKVVEGYVLSLVDSETSKKHLVNRYDFLSALGKTDNHDYQSYDMYEADEILQIAVFGKVLYG